MALRPYTRRRRQGRRMLFYGIAAAFPVIYRYLPGSDGAPEIGLN